MFKRRSLLITAGSRTDIVSSPPSTSRVTSALPSPITTFDAKVACAQPSKPASICAVWLESSSIACLPRTTKVGCSFSTIAFNSLATASGCNSLGAFDQNAAIGAHRQGGPDGFLRLGRPERYSDDLGRLARLLQTNRLFDSDFVEGIHRHLDVGGLDAALIRFDPDLDVVIDDTFD